MNGKDRMKLTYDEIKEVMIDAVNQATPKCESCESCVDTPGVEVIPALMERLEVQHLQNGCNEPYIKGKDNESSSGESCAIRQKC